MRAEDIEATEEVAYGVLGHHRPAIDDDVRRARARLRFERYLELDADGAWVAEVDGEIAGTALAILREGIWGLALFAVAERHQARGIGRRLLDASLTYGEDARGGLIMSSEDPKAMRRYSLAGFDLHPCVAAAGVLRPDRAPLPAGIEEPDRAAAVEHAAPISRAIRGASHGEDLGQLLDAGFRMLTLPGGFVIHDEGTVRILAALDEDTATALLTAAFAQAPPGATVQVDLITAGHDWAIRTCLRAGLALTPVGGVFTRGEVGPMRPYLPTGAWL